MTDPTWNVMDIKFVKPFGDITVTTDGTIIDKLERAVAQANAPQPTVETE